jgi:hypothetical protein
MSALTDKLESMNGMYYLRGQNFNRKGIADFKRREGMVVVHNHIAHTIDMPLGLNGFRAWQQVRTERLVECSCGWWGIKHYRIRAALLFNCRPRRAGEWQCQT